MSPTTRKLLGCTRPLSLLLGGALGLCLSLQASAVRAQDVVPGSRQASILTRALAYNKELKERAGEAIVLAVLYRPDNQDSETMSNDIFRAFQALESYSIRGLPFRVARLAYGGPGSLKAAIRDQGIDVLYVCSGFDSDVAALVSAARESKVLSMSGVADYVVRGLSLGVFVVDTKPTIYLNVAATQAEGAEFTPDFVKVTRVVESTASK